MALGKGAAQFDELVHDLLGDAVADLLPLHVVEGEEVAEKARGRVAPQEGVAVREDRPRAAPRRGDGGAHPGHAGSDYENVDVAPVRHGRLLFWNDVLRLTTFWPVSS